MIKSKVLNIMSQNYERLKQIIDEMNTSIAGMMGVEPINLAGKEHPSKKAKTNKNGLREKKVKEIVESIINEVSVGKWVRAASNSIPKREQEAEVAKKVLDVAKNNTSDVSNFSKTGKKLTKKQLADLDNNIDWEAYQNAQKTQADAQKSLEKAEKKLQHAKDVNDLNLPKEATVSTRRLLQANRNSSTERSENNKKSMGTGGRTSSKNLNRVTRSINIRRADPTQLKYLKKQKIAHSTAENALADVDRQQKLNNEAGDLIKKLNHVVSGDLYNKDQYTEKAASLEKNYNKLKKQEQAGVDHSNAQINQGLRNKLEKIYKNENLLESIKDNNKMEELIERLFQIGINESTIDSILSIVEAKVDLEDPGLLVNLVNKHKKAEAIAKQKAEAARDHRILWPKGVQTDLRKRINCSDETVNDIMNMVEAILSEKVDNHTHLGDRLTGVILRRLPIGELGKTDKLQKAGKIEADELTQAAEREGRNRVEVYLRRNDIKSQSAPENAKRNSVTFNQFGAENHAVLKRKEKK